MLSRKMKLFAAVLFWAGMMLGAATAGYAQDSPIDAWKKAAVQGDANAQDKLGTAYFYGHGDGRTLKDYGVDHDFKEAIKWWRKAADQGNADAQDQLGSVYTLGGGGIEKDFNEAFKLYSKAAAQGNADAELNLGSSYHYGFGVEKDEKEAVKWYRMSADQGYAKAELNLGTIYHAGVGVEKNDEEAIKWWRKAADQGVRVAQELLKRSGINDYVTPEQKTHDIGREIMTDIHVPVIQGGNNEREKDTILVEFKDCTSKRGDTIGLNDCLATAYEAYDKVMNQIYQQALTANDDATKKSLQESQQKWLSFRDAEGSAQGSYAATPRGTITGIAIGYQKLTAIRERISELMFYLGADQG